MAGGDAGDGEAVTRSPAARKGPDRISRFPCGAPGWSCIANTISRKSLEQAIGNHGLRATVEAALFRRPTCSAAYRSNLREAARCRAAPQKHGGMTIVSARVHAAWRDAAYGRPVSLLDGQGVHVRAQAQALAALAHAHRPDEARAADAARPP